MTDGSGMRVGSLDAAVTVSIWLSLAPAVMPVSKTVLWPEFTLIIKSGIVLRVGGSFTGLTVRTNVLLVLLPLVSVTLSVIGAEPN